MNIAKYDVVMIVSIGRITTGQFMLTELTHIYTPCGQYIGQVKGYDLVHTNHVMLTELFPHTAL